MTEDSNTQEEGKKELAIPINNQKGSFQQHLEESKRILFSAQFGQGKTTFLKFYFEDNEQYEAFHLFPVNYQISSNEKIMDYLKVDILTELYSRDKKLFKQSFTKYIKPFVKEGINTYLEPLLKCIPYIRQAYPIVQELSSIIKNVGKEVKEQNIPKNFYEGMTESDVVSEFIKHKIKEVGGNKKTVLILDDLDRIDPKHLFRILNIFSACFGNPEEINNKFGFDKIIVVADYNNLKSIFHHLYGEKTDDIGYFDKFYNKKVCEFSLNEEIQRKIGNFSDFVHRIEDKERKDFDTFFGRIACEFNEVRRTTGYEEGKRVIKEYNNSTKPFELIVAVLIKGFIDFNLITTRNLVPFIPFIFKKADIFNDIKHGVDVIELVMDILAEDKKQRLEKLKKINSNGEKYPTNFFIGYEWGAIFLLLIMATSDTRSNLYLSKSIERKKEIQEQLDVDLIPYSLFADFKKNKENIRIGKPEFDHYKIFFNTLIEFLEEPDAKTNK